MAVTYVGANSTTSGTITTDSVNVHASALAGDLMVVTRFHGSGSSLNTPGGWTSAYNAVADAMTVAVDWKTLSAGDITAGSINFTNSSGPYGRKAYFFRGHDTTTPFVVAPSASTRFSAASGQTLTDANMTPTKTGLAVWIHCAEYNTTATSKTFSYSPDDYTAKTTINQATHSGDRFILQGGRIDGVPANTATGSRTATATATTQGWATVSYVVQAPFADAASTEATFTVVANNAPATISGSASDASLSGVDAQNAVPTGTANATPSAATITADGQDAASSVVNLSQAVVATFMVDAANAGTTVGSEPTAATLTVDGQGAVPTGTTAANATEATLSVVGEYAGDRLIPILEATFSVGAENPIPNVQAYGEEGQLAFAGADATITTTSNAAPTAAELSADAVDPTVDASGATSASAVAGTLSVAAEDAVGLEEVFAQPDTATIEVVIEEQSVFTIAEAFSDAEEATLSFAGHNITATTSWVQESIEPVVEAQDPNTALDVPIGGGTLSVDGQNATVTTSEGALPQVADLSVAAQDSSITSVSRNFADAEAATLSVAAQTAGSDLQRGATEATFTVSGQDATIGLGGAGAAGSADLSVAAQDPTITSPSHVSVDAEAATLSVAAQTPNSDLQRSATEATFGVDAQNTTSTVSTGASEATLGVAANVSSATANSITDVDANDAEFNVEGLDATISASGNANAGSAAISFDGIDPVAGLVYFVDVLEAIFGVSANNTSNSLSESASAGVANLSMAALDAVASQLSSATPDSADFAFSAETPTVSTVYSFAAQLAELEFAAFAPGAAVTTTPVTAAFGLTALDVEPDIPPKAANISAITNPRSPTITPHKSETATVKGKVGGRVTISAREG